MPEVYQPNLDVYKMRVDLAAQQAQAGFYPSQQGTYGDQQAKLTGYRASYGDIPAMLMSGAQTAGSAFMGAAEGAGSLLSTLGSMIRPATYLPPAQAYTGYYGQYEQQTGILRELAIMAGPARAPRGVNAYQYGYNAAANLGDRVGGGVVAAGTVAAGLGGGYLGGLGGAIIGGAIGTAIAGPLGTAPGAFIGGLAGNIAGYMGVDSISEPIAQRREINSFLEKSSFRYVGSGSPMADPRLGAGMSFQARRDVTDHMKQMDVRDPGMDMGDLYNILKGATNMGLFAGTRDMDDFKTKFKNVVEGVKAITKTLNTTLEEGLQFMKDFKAINIGADQMGAIGLQASAIGKATGRTAQEVVGLGLQGAEMFRGTGIEMKIGYQAQVMNMAAIRSARDAGIISQEAIVQAGGEEAMSQRMTAGGLQFAQSALGRGYGAAFYNPSAGPAGFDAGAFTKSIMSGGGNLTDLSYRAALNLSSPNAIMNYTINQTKFMSEVGKTFGGKGLQLGQLGSAAATADYYKQAGLGGTHEERMKYSLMEDQGMTSDQADVQLGMLKNAPKEFADKMKGLQVTKTQQAIDEAYRTSGLHYRWDVAMDKVSAFAEPAMKRIDRLWDGAKEKFVDYYDKDIKGITRYDLGGTGGTALVGKQRPVTDRLKSRGEALDYSVGGGFFNPTKGEQVEDNLEILGLGGLTEAKRVDKLGSDDVILGSTQVQEGKQVQYMVNRKRVISRKALEGAVKDREMLLTVNRARAEELSAKDKTITSPGIDIAGAVEELDKEYGDKLSLDIISKKLFKGKGVTELDEKQHATLLLAADDSPVLKKIRDREVTATRGLKEQSRDLDVVSAANIEKTAKDIGFRVAKEMGLKNMFGITQELPKESLEHLESARLARESGDVDAEQKSLNLAVNAYADKYTGADRTKVRKEFRAYSLGTKYQKTADEYRDTGFSSLDLQVTMGGKQLLEAQNLAVDKSATIKDKKEAKAYLEKIYLGDDTSRATAIKNLDMTKGVGADIASLPMGAELSRTKGAIDLIEGVQASVDAKKMTKAEGAKLIDTTLKDKYITDDTARLKVVKAYTENKGADQAVQAVTQNLNLTAPTTTGATGPGSRPGGTAEAGGTAQGSAAELTAQQININYEILEALKAINSGHRGR